MRDMSRYSFNNLVLDKVHINFTDILGVYLTPVSTLILIFDMIKNRRRDIHISNFAVAFHSARNVYRTTPYIVCIFFTAHHPGNDRRPRARQKCASARGIGRPVPAPAGDAEDRAGDEDREQHRQERGDGRAYHRPFRQSTMYCAPAGNRASLASRGRSADSTRGKRKRKSVRSTSNPARVSSSRARGGVNSLASRSNGMRRMTSRVPGFHGLFSQKAKYPPVESDRCT